jgi:hypothetical protein
VLVDGEAGGADTTRVTVPRGSLGQLHSPREVAASPVRAGTRGGNATA